MSRRARTGSRRVRTGSRRARTGRGGVSAAAAARVAVALLLANLRYWTAVWPRVRSSLAHWERRALAIPQRELRSLALRKLTEERFNPELSATLATLAPAGRRESAAKAIVALQLSYDLLDAVTEQPLPDQLADGWSLHRPFVEALGAHAGASWGGREQTPLLDGDYLKSLTGAVRAQLATLPSRTATQAVAQASAVRCAQAQVRLHADALRPARERPCAREAPELLAGESASVLCLHALIAAAADPATSREQARRLDDLYMSIGALTMLDSIVDAEEDLLEGQPGWRERYDSEDQMGRRLAAVARRALDAADALPRSGHHTMTIAGAVAYYASAPSVRSGAGRSVVARVREQLGPLLGPPMIVMRAWRAAKRVSPAALWKAAMAALALTLVATAAAQATTLQATDFARLRYVSASGSTLYETGRASGRLPGAMHVHMRISSTFSGSFVIYASGGQIHGRGSARPHGSGRYESFAGSLRVTGGTGRYRHAHGNGHMYGVFDRGDYAITIKTTGKLYY